jgi:O-antigen/teichoic acid export membrane protein
LTCGIRLIIPPGIDPRSPWLATLLGYFTGRHISFSTFQFFAFLKALIYRFSPGALHSVYQRIEASPLGYRLAKGAFWSLSGALISRGLGLLSAILVGRMLGKQEYGELGIIQNTIGMFGTLAGFGMGLTANKYVAEFKRTDPDRAGRIIALASATAWISSGVMAVVLVVCAPWLAAKTLAAPHLAGLLQIGALLLLSSGVNGAQTGALSGFEAFKRIAHINLISGLLTFPLMVIGAGEWGVTGAVWGLIGSQVANCVMSFLAVRVEAAHYHIPLRYTGCFSDLSLFWRFSLPAVLTGLLNSVASWGAGALVVNQIGGYGDMGIYNAALRVKQVPELFLGMLIAPMLPILSEAFGKGDRVTYQRTLLFNFVLATLIIVPISLVQAAAPALTMMPFGAEYQSHPAIVTWLMLHAVLNAVTFPMGSILISMGEMWFSWLVNFQFALLFAGTAWFLVPRYGAAGYAAATTLAFAVGSIPCIIFVYRKQTDAMRFLRWGLLLVTVVALFGGCTLAARWLPFGLASVAGMAAAVGFLLFNYRTLDSLRSMPVRVS